MKSITLFTAACLSTCSIFIGCKKDKKDVAAKPTCRIITATSVSSGSGSDQINFTYNSEGKLSSVIEDTRTTTFVYSGNTVIANATSSGTFDSKTIVTLNPNGLASNIRRENDPAGTSWRNEAFQYNGTELIKTTSTGSSGGAPSISTATWSGGNAVSIESGSTPFTLEYFTDKPAQPGDYLQFLQLELGYEIYRTKNLLKSLSAGSDITNFDYTFDADGKITSLTITGSSTGTITYQHQCN